MALATVFVGIFFEKIFGEVLDLYQLPIGRNFEYLEKNGVLQFFIRLAGPDDNAVHVLAFFQLFQKSSLYYYLGPRSWTKAQSLVLFI